MDNSKTFPLSLDFDGEHYEGEITPSEEKGRNGMPVYLRGSFVLVGSLLIQGPFRLDRRDQTILRIMRSAVSSRLRNW
jgi:hypothetical protein